MENARKNLKARMFALRLMLAFAIIMIALQRTPLSGGLSGEAGNLQLGFCSGMVTAGVFFLVNMARTLRDEKLLKQWAVNEMDERNIAIRAKAGMPMLLVASVVMLMAGMVSAYWSETVMKTLFAAAVVQLLLGLGAKAYYSKTM